MRIRIEIDRLVLDGFDDHDHRRISSAIKFELNQLTKDMDLSEVKSIEIPNLDAGSFNNRGINPQMIGTKIIQSINRSLDNKLLHQNNNSNFT